MATLPSHVCQAGTQGEYEIARTFWRDEYRMNAKLFNFPKPVASLMQGFTMGGGVGIGCHGSHRVVGESSQIAMPETGIGLIPDVGGTLILARAPGRIGEYLGATGGAHWASRCHPRRICRLLRARGKMGRADGGTGPDRRLGSH